MQPGAKIPLAGWVIICSVAVFSLTWVFATPRPVVDGSKHPALAPRLHHPSLAATQLQPALSPSTTTALTNRPRTVFGANRPLRIAFSFDDGPHPVHTARLLRILKRYAVPATFFVNGRWLNVGGTRGERARAIVLQAHREGHTIGNHTFSHELLSTLPKERQTWEIVANEILLSSLLGERTKLFRPPYGKSTAHALEVLRRYGYTEMMWNVAAADQDLRDPELIASTVLMWIRRHEGGIVLLHDRFPWSVEATEMVLERLAKRNCKRLAAGQKPFIAVPLDSFLRGPSQSRGSEQDETGDAERNLSWIEQECRTS